MAMISINGKEYNSDDLPAPAKAQFMSLQFCDAELARIENELLRLSAQQAVLKTARISYSNELIKAVTGPAEAPGNVYANDVIKFY